MEVKLPVQLGNYDRPTKTDWADHREVSFPTKIMRYDIQVEKKNNIAATVVSVKPFYSTLLQVLWERFGVVIYVQFN